VIGAVVLAQGQQGQQGPPPGQGNGGPGGPGGPGGFGGPGGRGGPGGMMDPAKSVSVTDIQLAVLDKALTLTADQKTQIQAITKEFRDAARKLMPRPNDDGTMPDKASMDAAMVKITALDKAASDKITALLTEKQKTALAKLISDINLYRILGIPAEVAPKLNLTADQLKKLTAIADKARTALKALAKTANRQSMFAILREANDAAMDVLTDDQYAIVEQAMKNNQRGGPGGGPGGQGGPPPGGPDGPPAPDQTEMPQIPAALVN